MANEVSNADIFNALMNMRGDISRVEGKIDGHSTTLKTHISDDKVTHAALVASVRDLQISQARQRGFITGISALGGIIGTAITLGVKYFFGSHS